MKFHIILIAIFTNLATYKIAYGKPKIAYPGIQQHEPSHLDSSLLQLNTIYSVIVGRTDLSKAGKIEAIKRAGDSIKNEIPLNNQRARRAIAVKTNLLIQSLS